VTLAGAVTPTSRLAGGLTALPETTAGRNLVANAGFEDVDGARPGGWDASQGWHADSDVSRSGSTSIRRSGAAGTASQAVPLKTGIYTLSAWVKTDGLGDGAGSGLRLVIDSRSAGVNEWKASDVISGTSDWKRYEVGPVAIATDRTVRVRLETYNGAEGTAWIDDVMLARHTPPPVDAFLIYPNYRGMLFDDQPQAISVDVSVTPPAGSLTRYTVAVTLADERSGTAVATRAYPAAAAVRATVPADGMRAGIPYLVTVALIDSATRDAAYAHPPFRVSKVPAAAKASMRAAVDDRNRLLVRGTPRFVLGVYDAAADGRSGRLGATKVNMYINPSAGGALISTPHPRGVMYLHTGPCAAPHAVAPAYLPDMGGHPARAGHHTIDECTRVAPEAFAEYQRHKQLEGDGITLATVAGGAADVAMWRQAADVLATVVYPMYGPEPAGGYRHRMVADVADAARRAVHDARPVMTVLPASALGAFGRAPAVSEMRSHAYMAIVEGARGLWWSGVGDDTARLQSVVDEIAALEPALVADDARDALASVSTPAVRTKVKVVGGTGYLFAYNGTGEPVTAAFGWNTAVARVMVHAENRSIAAIGAGFSDTFQPYEAHVYVISSVRMTERN
jgi:hypothetical protein